MVCVTMPLMSTSDAHRIFESLDQNNDGLLTLDELSGLLEKVGIHANEDELASLVGKDGLNYDEFCYFYDTILLSNNSDHQSKSFDYHCGGDNHALDLEEEDKHEDCDLYKAFKVFDLNGDGLISSQELQSVLSILGMWDKHGRLDVDRIMRKYDVNSDGFVDFSEFKTMMLAY